jgi:hypothetical protein
MLTRIAGKMSSQGYGGSQEHVKLESGVLAHHKHAWRLGRTNLSMLSPYATRYRVKSYRVMLV